RAGRAEQGGVQRQGGHGTALAGLAAAVEQHLAVGAAEQVALPGVRLQAARPKQQRRIKGQGDRAAQVHGANTNAASRVVGRALAAAPPRLLPAANRISEQFDNSPLAGGTAFGENATTFDPILPRDSTAQGKPNRTTARRARRQRTNVTTRSWT